MKRAAALALAALAFPAAADASVDTRQLSKATGLHIAASDPAGRAAIVRFMRREVRLERSDGFRLADCGGYRTVTCLVTEYGIPDTENIIYPGDSFDLEYAMKARHHDGRWRVWSPDIAFGP